MSDYERSLAEKLAALESLARELREKGSDERWCLHQLSRFFKLNSLDLGKSE